MKKRDLTRRNKLLKAQISLLQERIAFLEAHLHSSFWKKLKKIFLLAGVVFLAFVLREKFKAGISALTSILVPFLREGRKALLKKEVKLPHYFSL